jgi:hypothetical protein
MKKVGIEVGNSLLTDAESKGARKQVQLRFREKEEQRETGPVLVFCYRSRRQP